MGYFSDEALANLRREVQSIPGKQAALQQQYLQMVFRQDRAKEFAHHGFVRRISILARCIKNVFGLIPPERADLVGYDVRSDAEINIQTSVFNVFAAADNLAWIWVVENGIRQADGTDLPETWVGLRRTNRRVRETLPQNLRDHLAGLDDWFDTVDNYRHALAHRIPLYIPPYVVSQDDEAQHRALEARKMQSLLAGDIDEHRRLADEQKQLEIFRPWMQHSFGENARSLVFHPQLLANFNTVEELGRKFLDALAPR